MSEVEPEVTRRVVLERREVVRLFQEAELAEVLREVERRESMSARSVASDLALWCA